MAKNQEPVNPFYVLLVILGVVFLVTACAYGVMAYRAIGPAGGRAIGEHVLTAFLDRHGIAVLGWELGLLAAATFAAMGLDRRRSLGEKAKSSSKTDAEPTKKSSRVQ